MISKYEGGVISATAPTVTPPIESEGGSASGMWTKEQMMKYKKLGTWPQPAPAKNLFTWGANGNGQLGLGNLTTYSSPKQVGALTNWKRVSAGTAMSIGVKVDGTLWSWGRNHQGQLGLGNTTDYSSPKQVGALTNWLDVSASPGGIAYWWTAVKTDGTMWNVNFFTGMYSRYSSPRQVGTATTWVSVSAGSEYIMMRKNDNTLWAIGENQYGQLGVGGTTDRLSPSQVGGSTWSAVVAGYEYTVAVTTGGFLYTWGRNNVNQLGNSLGGLYYANPTSVDAATDWKTPAAQSVNSGGGMGCIKTTGTLFTWGSGSSGALGDGTTVQKTSPVQVGALSTWSQLAGANNGFKSIKSDGTLWAWGYGGQGQLGDGTTVSKSSPVQIGALTTWFHVSKSGSSISCAAVKKVL
jgi:alpha-tubulin suppressor-like RCC1 family protein